MPNVSISVGGQVISLPGVYPTFNVQPTVPSGFLPTGPVIFLAQGFGGVPFVNKDFTTSQALKAAMRGAPSANFADFIFNPSTQVNGASLVTYINVAPNTQSSAALVNSGGVSVINLLSADYGLPSNLLQFITATGSIAGKKLTLTDGFSGSVVTGDNLGVPFQLAYTGTATTVTYAVQSTIAGQATKFVITSPNVGESISLDLTTQTFSTVNAIIQFLNGTGFYVAIGISNGQLPSSNLDIVSSIALPAPVGASNQLVNVTATLGDVTFFINSSNPALATASIAGGIISSTTNAPSNTALQFFSGATNGVASLANYSSGLAVALNQPAWVVIADSGSAGVRALLAQHVAQASGVIYRRWRRYVTGSLLGEPAATAQTNARNLNQNNVSYVWPGIQRTSVDTGLNTTFDGLHVAAAVAGMMAGNSVPMPLTNKTLVGNGVEVVSDLATKAASQNNGVLVLDLPTETRLPTLLSDVTTWQNDSTATNVFNQQIACEFALGYYLKAQLQPFVGQIQSSFDLARAQRAVQRLLNAIIYNGSASTGILNDWDATSLVLSFNGTTQTLSVSVNVVFVGQNRFIVFTTTVNPLNIQISPTGVVTGIQ